MKPGLTNICVVSTDELYEEKKWKIQNADENFSGLI